MRDSRPDWPAPGSVLHFVGAGGAGMAPLAHIAMEQGYRISGSDLCDHARCQALRRGGARIATGHRAENLPAETALVIFSSAAAPDNPELALARKRGIPCCRRGEFLSMFADRCRRAVAVAGAHGKTSVTALLSWILRRNGIPAGYMIGGELRGGYPNCAAGNGDIFVTEADESDGTFALLSGEVAVIPNIDDDHAWTPEKREALLRQFAAFAGQFRRVISGPDPRTRAVLDKIAQAAPVPPGVMARVLAEVPERMIGFERANAALAVLAAEQLGLEREAALTALRDFPGVARRMTEHGRSEDGKIVLVEDYAHHPAELEAALSVMRRRYAGRRLLVIFQPHRFQRLERYLDRFAALLATGPDQVWLPPVFTAWSETGRCDSALLADRIRASGGAAEAVPPDYAALAERVFREAAEHAEAAVIAVIGAGDLNAVLPFLRKMLKKSGAEDCQNHRRTV